MYNTPMILKMIRRIFGLSLLIFSLVALIWSLSPGKYILQTTQLSQAEMVLPGVAQATGGSPGSTPAILAPETRLLEFAWSERMRLGDDDTLRLTVGFPSQTSANSNRNETPKTADNGALPEIYSAYNLVLQSHLDLPGITHVPTGEVSQAMLPDKPVVFIWYLRPPAPGVFSGKVWLHLRFVPRSAGQAVRILLVAQQLDIKVVTLLGMSGSQARLFGSLGLVLGAFFGLDGLVSWCFVQVLKRKKGKKP